MFELQSDIREWVNEHFSKPEKAVSYLEPLTKIDSPVDCSRIIRCVLFLSERDYDSISVYVRKASEDYRYVIWMAEYDNRNVRKYNFNFGLYSQIPYSYSE